MSSEEGGKYYNLLKKADAFGQEFSFLMNDKHGKLKSLLGVFAGFCVVVLLVAYGAVKLQTMFEYSESFVQQPKAEQYFDDSFVFDSSHGFQIAFTMTPYDDEDEPWDETYGRLVARQKIWGERDENGKLKKLYFKDHILEPCKREYFLLGDSDDRHDLARFNMASENQVNDLKRKMTELKCLEEDTFELYGDYNTERGSQFVISFERCD